MAIPELVIGNGPVRVVALHGWFGSASGWGLLPELLDPEAWSVAFLDDRGYGARKDESGPFTIEQVAADAFALADQLGWDRFAVLGHSMGGVAALRVYADAPERVTAVLGVSPVPASGVPFDEQGRRLFENAAHDDDARATIINLTTGNRQSATWVRQVVAHSVAQSSREAFGAYLHSWSSADFAEELPRPSVPVVVAVGEHDPALGEDTAKATWLQQLPDARLDVLRGAGHYPMHETPVALFTSLETTLSAIA